MIEVYTRAMVDMKQSEVAEMEMFRAILGKMPLIGVLPEPTRPSKPKHVEWFLAVLRPRVRVSLIEMRAARKRLALALAEQISRLG